MPDDEHGAARHDIFISYASKDQELADRIVREIEHRGLTCWISSRDIRPGADFQGSIVAALEQSGIVLLLFSQNANLSSEVPKELSLASSRRKPIIPARIEDILPTGALAYQLTHAQFIDLFRNFDNRLNELCGYLAEMLKASGRAERSLRQVTPAPAAPGTLAANALLAAAAIAAIVLVTGTIAWVAVARHQGQQAGGVRAASSGPAASSAREAAFAYYAALTGAPGAGLPVLAARLGAQVDFYGKRMTRNDLLSLQSGYMQRWPDRGYTVRPQSLVAACDSGTQSCVVSGVVDYVLRSEPRNVFVSGAESFRLGVLAAGDSSVITSISSTALSRRTGALHGGARP
jgi:hypothetical protein